jgi:predicted GNAT family acetyltransferase
MIVAFLNNIKEFSVPQNMEAIKKDFGTRYLIFKDGVLVHHAALVAESKIACMLVGLATASSEREKGLAQYSLTQLIQAMQTKKKNINLFYDNPKAGILYKNLGFKEIDLWALFR